MFSSEAIAGLSCSSKSSALEINENARCAPTSNFSIRDYVFASRSKDVNISWPFTPKFLHHCLKHGIKDLLPPFQPPDSVKAQCLCKGVNYKQPIKSLEAAQASPQAEFRKFKDAALLCESSVDRGAKLDELIDRHTETSQRDNYCEQVEGACVQNTQNQNITEGTSDVVITQLSRLPKRIEASSLSNREDPLPTCSKVSDLMASKVCPVCRIFSSTSNTTLNAHIDQCLSVEYNGKPIAKQLLKPKVKPRKIRLMEDIYTTAAHCTLEDLNRRNCLNWASELAATPANDNVCSNTQKPNSPQLDSSDEKSGGAVYVDSHGIKLLILSKFNDTQPVISKEGPRPNKTARDKAGRSTFTGKGDFFGRNLKRKMNYMAKGKNIGSFKLVRTQVQAIPEGGDRTDTRRKEESPSCPTKCPDPSKHSKPGTLRHQVSSRNSNLPKSSSYDKPRRNLVAVTGYLSKRSPKQSSNSSIITGRMSKLSNFSSRRSSVDFMSKTVYNMEGSKQKLLKSWSHDGLPMKYTRDSGASASSQRSKSKENFTVMVDKSEHCSSAGLAHQPTLALERTLDNISEKPSSSKKLRNYRMLSRTCEHRKISSSVFGGTHGSIEAGGYSMHVERLNKKLRTHRSNIVVRCRTSTGEVSSSQPKMMPESDRQGGSIITELPQHTALVLPLEDECLEPELEIQAEGEVSGAHESNDSMEEVIAEYLTTKPEIFGCKNLASDSIAKNSLLVEEHPPALDLCNSHGEPTMQTSFDRQEACCDDASRDELVNGDIELLANSEILGEDLFAVQSTECSTLSSTHGINVYTTSHADPGQNATRGKSSVISSREEQGTSAESIKGFGRGSDKIAGQELSSAQPSMADEPPNKKPCRHGSISELDLSFKGTQAFSLSNAPRTSSSFTAYRSLGTNQTADSCLKSPAQSNPTRISVESAIDSAACPNYDSSSLSPAQIPSPSNPVLRLMGKDLVVMNKGEILNHQVPNSDYYINGVLQSDGSRHQAVVPFFCLPSHGQVLSTDVSNGFGPLLANLYPGVGSNIMMQRSNSERQGSILPSHIIFQCPAGQISPMYYTPDPALITSAHNLSLFGCNDRNLR